MRLSALVPVAIGAAALVLSFLCLFAGSSRAFMEDYAIVTLNTSRIGENVLNTTSSSSSNPLTSFIHNLTPSIQNEISSDLNSLARSLGVHDFYSAHLLDYCEGYYTPAALPNATLKASDIHKNVTSCSKRTGGYNFDPTTTLQRELNASGHSNINLTDLHWPSAVPDGLNALRVAQKAAFILYCVAIGLIGISTICSLVSVLFEGRLSASVNILVSGLAFLAIGVASAITTAVAVKAQDVINDHGNAVGVSAKKGGKFMVLTWVATGLMLLNTIVWFGGRMEK